MENTFTFESKGYTVDVSLQDWLFAKINLNSSLFGSIISITRKLFHYIISYAGSPLLKSALTIMTPTSSKCNL